MPTPLNFTCLTLGGERSTRFYKLDAKGRVALK